MYQVIKRILEIQNAVISRTSASVPAMPQQINAKPWYLLFAPYRQSDQAGLRNFPH